jgi:hypothetical protein
LPKDFVVHDIQVRLVYFFHMKFFKDLGYKCTAPVDELESTEYGACTFMLDGLAVRYRKAKITPTKVGQFVTLWKRKGKGPIQPCSVSDSLDLFIVFVQKGPRSGYFVFSKKVLAERGVLATRTQEGKRALRVYPPWDKTVSAQAKKTQLWQADYFLETSESSRVDKKRADALLSGVG